MASWRSIEYYEVAPQGSNEQYAQDASRVLRPLFFPGRPNLARRQEIAQQWLGYARVKMVPLSGKRYITRVTPHFYPETDFAVGAYLYAQTLPGSEMVVADDSETTASHAPGDQTALSDWWKATFEYRSLPYDIHEDESVLATAGELYVSVAEAYPDEGDALRRGWAVSRYVSKLVEPGGRVIPLRNGCFYYVGVATAGGKDIPTLEPFPFNETLQHVNYVWHQVPLEGYPIKAVQTQLNTVNDAIFDGYPKGTLLFIDARETPRRDPFGQRTLDATYRFLFAPRCNAGLVGPLGHNAILRVDRILGPRWTLVSTDATNGADKLPYRATDFSKLFHPDQP